MIDYKELVDALRDEGNCDVLDYIDAAATAIQTLTGQVAEKDAEIERLKGEAIAGAQFKSWRDNVNALCESYKVARDRLQAEWDNDTKIIRDAKWSLLYKRASAIRPRWPKEGKHNND